MDLTIQEWGAIGELAGAILLFVSLSYVGFQIQQTRKSMRAAAAQARSDSSSSLMTSMQDESFSSLFVSSSDKTWEELTPQERIRLVGFFQPLLNNFLNNYYQRKLGLLDADQAIFLETMPVLAQGIGYEYWKRTRDHGMAGYPEDFIQHVNLVIDRTRQHKLYETPFGGDAR